MYEFIKGEVVDIYPTEVVIENNGIGYLIRVANPYTYEVGSTEKIYIYQQLKEDENTLFGFKNIGEKELFLRLISVKGLGGKMALPILASGSINGIKDAIERENILYLKKFPKIGDKLARQIILDLKGKLASDSNNEEVNNNLELIEALKGLGYKEKDIKSILVKVDSKLEIESQIKEALKLMLK